MFELILVGDGVVRLRRQPRVRIRDPLLPTAWRACARWPQALIDPGSPRRRQPEIEVRAGTNPRAGGGSSLVQRARTECDRSHRRKGPAAAKSPRRMIIGRSKGKIVLVFSGGWSYKSQRDRNIYTTRGLISSSGLRRSTASDFLNGLSTRFTVSTQRCSSNSTVNILATYAGVTKTAALTVTGR